jgi:hypothetical protein
MGSLNAFLNPVKVENKEVIVSNRFAENGKLVPFIIRPIIQEENKELIKAYTKRNKKGEETFDRAEYIAAMTAQAVIFPDLKNAELQGKHNVVGETALLQKMLFAGEFATLANEVQKISGLDEDINEDIEEAKN